MKKLLIVVTLTILSAIGVLGQANERLGTRQWKLVQLNGMNVANSSKAFLELNLNETRFTGNTGCNRMFGAVDVRGRRIDLSNIGTTKMACMDPRARRTETQFVKALEDVDRFREIGNSLELYVRNRLVLIFRLVPNRHPADDSLTLESKKWVLEAIKGVPVSKIGRTAFIVFDSAKGSAGGNSSCNVFGGSYTATSSTIKITEIVSTMRACIEDERMTIERDFLAGLPRANGYDIKGGRLRLYRNGSLLLTLIGEAK